MNNYSIILADNQDITAAGIAYFLSAGKSKMRFSEAENKKELIAALSLTPSAWVVLDYSLFDFTSVEELLIVQHRFSQSHFLLLSEELTDDFVKQVTYNSQSFSILLKNCQQEEVDAAFDAIQNGSYYICRQISNHLSSPKNNIALEDNLLTNTEREILRLIASGKSTKQIAADRFLSVHTVITHRKNIFRKLEVNNVHEATKYALRAGIVDASDYFI